MRNRAVCRIQPPEEFVAKANPRLILFVSATGWLAGPTRSLATVIRHVQLPDACVLASPRGELPDLVLREGIASQFIPLRRHSRWERLSRLMASMTASAWLVRHRRVVKAVHANGLSELNLIGPGAFIAGTPVVVWNHSSVPSPIAGRMARLWRFLLRYVRWAAVSPIAEVAVRAATRLTEAEVAIIPNPIDPGEVVSGGSRSQSGSPLKVGYFSEASDKKGFGVLLEAARLLQNESIEWLLYTELLPGTSAWRLANAISSLKLCGRQEGVARAYRECDIVFCPSFGESFGRVAAEAMANGIPVVASDIEAFRNLVGNGKAGLLFATGNAREAARVISELACTPSLREALGAEGRRRAGVLEPWMIVPRLAAMYGSKPRHGS